MNTEFQEIKEELKQIQERNRRVENDKAWETSLLRKIVIALLTYCVIALFMWSIKVEKPFLNAVIPTIGYVFSTLSLGVLKRMWIERSKKKPSS